MLLQNQAQIADFGEIDGPIGGQCRSHRLRTGFGTINFRVDGPISTGLSVNLFGNRPFPDAMLSRDQDRTVAVRDAVDRSLSTCVDRGKRPSLPF